MQSEITIPAEMNQRNQPDKRRKTTLFFLNTRIFAGPVFSYFAVLMIKGIFGWMIMKINELKEQKCAFLDRV